MQRAKFETAVENLNAVCRFDLKFPDLTASLEVRKLQQRFRQTRLAVFFRVCQFQVIKLVTIISSMSSCTYSRNRSKSETGVTAGILGLGLLPSAPLARLNITT